MKISPGVVVFSTGDERREWNACTENQRQTDRWRSYRNDVWSNRSDEMTDSASDIRYHVRGWWNGEYNGNASSDVRGNSDNRPSASRAIRQMRVHVCSIKFYLLFPVPSFSLKLKPIPFKGEENFKSTM